MTYMDTLTNSWFCEEGLDDSIFMYQYDFMEPITEELAAIVGDDFPNSLFQGSNSSSSETLVDDIPRSNQSQQISVEPPAKHRKTNLEPTPPSGPIILNFEYANSSENLQEAAVFDSLRPRGLESTKRISRARPPSQTYDHIAAERKRRELLSKQFATLSAMVPGLKKMDKTSVLRDAINYLNNLRDKVKTLEEQATRQAMESLVLINKSYVMDKDISSSDENNDFSKEQPLPEIEARLCNNQILLRIQCEKIKGVLVKLLGQVEKLNLTVVSSNILSFGNFSLDITIIAEMEKESSVLLKEIVKVLHSALRRTA